MAKTTQEILDESTKVAQGAAAMIGGTFEQGKGFTPGVIARGDLVPANPIEIPPTPTDTIDYSGLFANGVATTGALTAPKTNQPTEDWFTKFLAQTEKPESLSSLYESEREKSGLGAKEQAVVESQKQLDLLNAQMAGLQAEATGAPIQIQQESEGRGRTAAGVRPLETARLRDIALRSLPLQSQILAQQAVVTGNQGMLRLAQDRLDTLFTIKSKDIENDYDYRKELRNRVYDYATAKEKEKLDALQKVDDKKYEESKNRLNLINEWSKTAFANNQSTLIGELAGLDPKDPNFQTKLSAITAKLQPKNEFRTQMVGDNLIEFETDAQGRVINQRVIASKPKEKKTENIENILTGEYGNLVKSAANLYSTKFGQESAKETIAGFLADEDYGSAYKAMAESVEQSLTGQNKTQFSSARTDYEVMSGMKDAIQAYADGGGDMGLLTGKEEDIKRKLGIDSGKASALAVQLWREFQYYRSNMTGAAFTEQESRDYASVNPTLGKSLNLNLSVIEGAMNQLENRITKTVKSKLPKAQDIYEKISGGGEEDDSNLSLDDAYSLYLQFNNSMGGQTTPATK